MSLKEEIQQRVILKRGKTARVSFADNQTIESVKYIQAENPVFTNENSRRNISCFY
jgi:hypothetical protein